MEQNALVPRSTKASLASAYRPPRPGRSWRSNLRTVVLVGGSIGIGTGVALGAFGIAPAAMMAVGLATVQVVAQTLHQNRLGQDVMGGIARGDLERARFAAEQALEASPSGAMRTLAAANLASVLMQSDLVLEGVEVLERWPPGVLDMPLSTVLWLNNRAFAAAVLREEPRRIQTMLDEAERRLERAGPRGFGGEHNHRKVASAVAGTRAMERLVAGQAEEALSSLALARQLDEAAGATFRLAERELCRVVALYRTGRKDEAILALAALREQPLTERQRGEVDKFGAELELS